MDNRERASGRPKGRDDELAELVALLERPGAAIVVAGEPGIGKTGLVRRSLELAGVPVMTWSGRLDAAPEWAPGTGRDAVATPASAGAPVTARAFGARFDDAAAHGWFVLVVDDAERLDGAAVAIVNGLLRRARGAKWSIVVVGRRFPHGFGDEVTRIELGPLPARLMETRFAARRRDPSDRSILVAAHGNLAAMNRLVSIEESINRPDDLSFLAELVEHRLRVDPLGDMAGLAALAFGPFDLNAAATILDASAASVAEALTNPRRTPLVHLDETGRLIVPVHPAIGHAVAVCLSEEERVRLHRVLAEVFGAMPDPEMLIPAARHLALTAAPDDAKVELALRAVRVLEGSGRLADALSLLRDAAGAVEDPSSRALALRVRGWLLGRLGLVDEARDALRCSLELLGADPPWRSLAMVSVTWAAIEPIPATAEPALRAAVRLAADAIDRSVPELATCVEAALIAIDPSARPDAGAQAASLLDRVAEIEHPDARAVVIRLAGAAAAGQRRIDEVDRFVVRDTSARRHPLTTQATGQLWAVRALARGTRTDVERVIDDWSAAFAAAPVVPWSLDLDVLRVVHAFDDADPEALTTALDGMIANHADLVLPAYVTFGMQYLWRFHTGTPLPVRLPPVGRDLPPGLDALLLAGTTLFDALGGDLAALDRAQELLDGLLAHEGGGSRDGADDSTWAVRQALVACAGSRLADPRWAEPAARSLMPHLDEWVMVGCVFPIGPVGCFIADALRAAGDGEAAMCAARAALDVARRRRSYPWIARSLVLLARTAEATGADLDTASVREEAVAIAERFGFATALQRLRTAPTLAATGLRRDELIGELLLGGRSNREIATVTGLSIKSVERILSQLYRRLGVANRQEAVLRMRSDREHDR